MAHRLKTRPVNAKNKCNDTDIHKRQQSVRVASNAIEDRGTRAAAEAARSTQNIE